MSAEDGTTLDAIGRAAARAGTARERLFYALWPSRDTAMALHSLACRQAASTGGRVTRMDSIHLTVAFLGDVPIDRVDVFRAVPPEIAVPPFAMQLDRVGHWVRNGIVWAAPSMVPDALADLQARLTAWVRGQGIVPDARPFRPHVTLLRKAARGELTPASAPVEWRAEAFVLVRSGRLPDGSRYETIGRFPLNPGVGNPS